MEVAAAAVACCRGRDDGHAGEEERSSAKDAAKVVVPIADDKEVVEPCVIAVDDCSVDRALVTALLRRSKYRGEERLRVKIAQMILGLIFSDKKQDQQCTHCK
jgi:hypothetical protein